MVTRLVLLILTIATIQRALSTHPGFPDVETKHHMLTPSADNEATAKFHPGFSNIEFGSKRFWPKIFNEHPFNVMPLHHEVRLDDIFKGMGISYTTEKSSKDQPKNKPWDLLEDDYSGEEEGRGPMNYSVMSGESRKSSSEGSNSNTQIQASHAKYPSNGGASYSQIQRFVARKPSKGSRKKGMDEVEGREITAEEAVCNEEEAAKIVGDDAHATTRSEEAERTTIDEEAEGTTIGEEAEETTIDDETEEKSSAEETKSKQLIGKKSTGTAMPFWIQKDSDSTIYMSTSTEATTLSTEEQVETSSMETTEEDAPKLTGTPASLDVIDKKLHKSPMIAGNDDIVVPFSASGYLRLKASVLMAKLRNEKWPISNGSAKYMERSSSAIETCPEEILAVTEDWELPPEQPGMDAMITEGLKPQKMSSTKT